MHNLNPNHINSTMWNVNHRKIKIRNCILIVVHALIAIQSLLVLEELCSKHKKEQIRRQRVYDALNRTHKVRTSWTVFAASLSSRHFRRMFRMDRQCFQELCGKIEKMVGREEFKSEHYKQTNKLRD